MFPSELHLGYPAAAFQSSQSIPLHLTAKEAKETTNENHDDSPLRLPSLQSLSKLDWKTVADVKCKIEEESDDAWSFSSSGS